MPRYIVRAILNGKRVITTIVSRDDLNANIDGPLKLAERQGCNPSRLEKISVKQCGKTGKIKP